MNIDIVGEDQVTQEIIERLLNDYRKDILIKNRLPARGSQVKNLTPKYNNLNTPIFILTDLDDYDCAPSLIKDWLGTNPINSEMLFRVAQEEAESWLMADREGFAKWLEVDINLIPEPKIINKKTKSTEIICPLLKPSLYMMLKIASHSNNKELKQSLTPVTGAKKGRGYNSAIIPFIKKQWNVENASKNSDSLARAIKRLLEFKK